MNQMDNKNSVAKHHDELEKGHHSSHRLGIVTISLIFGLFGLWSVFADIETTITANGKIITHTFNKSVMHPQGGIVKNIFIEEGALVKKDQPLLEIDSTQSRSELDSHIKKHDTNLFLICRLKAESEMQKNVECSEYEQNIIDSANVAQLTADTKMLFDSDMRNIQAKIDLLESQNEVLKAQDKGLEGQIASNKRLLVSFERELIKWQKLLKSDAVDELKIIETQRKIEEIKLQIGTLQSKIEENIATIKSQEQQIELEKETFKNTALQKRNEIELENKLIHDAILSLENTIQNATIRSPSEGLVTDMKIHAIREVVSPQDQIMTIVPNAKNLIIEAYVQPIDVEKIYVGQKAEISFPSFVDPSAMPVEGVLTYISADAITAEGAEESYYTVLLDITPKGFDTIKENGFNILPGMPTTAFIKSGKQTLMEYLMQPIIQMFKGIYNAN